MGSSRESLGPWDETEWQDVKWRRMLELTDTNNGHKKQRCTKTSCRRDSNEAWHLCDVARVSRVRRLTRQDHFTCSQTFSRVRTLKSLCFHVTQWQNKSVCSDSFSPHAELFLHVHKLSACSHWLSSLLLFSCQHVFYALPRDFIRHISVKHPLITINPEYLLKFNWLPCLPHWFTMWLYWTAKEVFCFLRLRDVSCGRRQ